MNKTDNINEAIKNRRSIYPAVYTDETIPKDVINTILENANWAPSHRQTRPWHFVVFSGAGRNKLAEFQSSLYKKLTSPEKFEEKKFNMLARKPLQCSHVIAICMKRDKKQTVPEIEEIEAVACAVQNMHLTASANGIGAYWGTGGITYKEEAKPFFELEKEDKLLGFFFLGYPKIKWPSGIKRDWTDHVSWVDQ
jgi:nitroreductase